MYNITQINTISKVKSERRVKNFHPKFLQVKAKSTDEILEDYVDQQILKYNSQGKDFFESQQTIHEATDVSISSIKRWFKKHRSFSTRYIIGQAIKRDNSYKNHTIHIKFTPLYSLIITENSSQFVNELPLSPQNEVMRGLMFQPSRTRTRLVNRIVSRLGLTLDEQVALEAYTTQELRGGFREMLRYLFAGKRFYKRYFYYFRAILEKKAGLSNKPREILKQRVTKSLSSIDDLVKKHYQWVEDRLLKSFKLPQFEPVCILTSVWVNEFVGDCYWSDNEYDYRE